MTLRVRLRPSARLDLIEARDWYDSKEPGLGREFLMEFSACIERIRTNPEAHPVVHEDYRRAPLHRFPYSVFYRIEPRTIGVVACFHASRDPKSWKRRV